MQHQSQSEIYKKFIDFVSSDIQLERKRVNRKMFWVLLWAFIVPATLTTTILILMKFGIISRSRRFHLDWLMLVVPICYSLYILGSQVLLQIPKNFKKGGIASTLGQAAHEGQWRDQVSEKMIQLIEANAEQWEWIVMSFKMDLKALQARTRHMTVLAGAVLYLLMHGIDAITDEAVPQTWVRTPTLGWVETSGDNLSQYVGLALFLILLYLSGSQVYSNLYRYLNCAELVARQQQRRK